MDPRPDQEPNARTKAVVMTGVGVFLLLFVAVSLISFFRRQGATEPTQAPVKQQAKKAVKAEVNPLNLPGFPTVEVGSWNLLGAASIAGKEIPLANIFGLKENLTKNDFTQLSLKLGLQPQTAEETTDRIIAGRDLGNDSSMLYFQKKSGSFLYMATGALAKSASASAPLEGQGIQQFVTDLTGDDSVRMAATYQQKNTPGITYYEFHRSWQSAGLPIANMIGLFNTPERIRLSDLPEAQARGAVADQLPRDENITSTSDQTDGRARPNDFNTMTVGVRDGSVVSIVSKLRFLQGAPASAQVIPYAEAVKRLRANKSAYVYTSPSGSGAVRHEDVYPGNKASFRSVTVTDSRLMYLEELPDAGQSTMAPYYIFRGYGVLSSGYRANVLAAVAASNTNVLGASLIAQRQSQQQGTFSQEPAAAATLTPVPEPTAVTVTPKPTNKLTTPVPTEKPVVQQKCVKPPSLNDLVNKQTKAGLVYGTLEDAVLGTENVEWWIVPSSSIDVQQLSGVLLSIYSGLSQIRMRSFTLVAKEYERAAGSSCAVRITGSSPTVFLYSDAEQNVTVHPSRPTYADPNLLDGIWSVSVRKSALNANNNSRNYLYYEYEHTKFAIPEKGWIVPNGKLESLSEHISKQLGLNSIEKERLLFELNHASKKYSGTLFIGLIDRTEVDEKLPIRISPRPARAYRFHFYVAPAHTRSVPAPELSPVNRSGFTLVEFGAATGN